VQQEAAAAYARGLRLDQIEHPLRRDRGVQRIAAELQDLDRGIRGMGVCGNRHVAAAGHRRSRLVAAGGLRLFRLGPGTRRPGEKSGHQ
jgi:hypothetical protein